MGIAENLFKLWELAAYPGKAFIACSDCRACHRLHVAAAGPNFTAFTGRFKKDPTIIDNLSKNHSGRWHPGQRCHEGTSVCIASLIEIVKI